MGDLDTCCSLHRKAMSGSVDAIVACWMEKKVRDEADITKPPKARAREVLL